MGRYSTVDRAATPDACLASISMLRATPRCQNCACLDWALDELQTLGDAALARQAAALRRQPATLLIRLDCRSCPALDGVLGWLLAGRPAGAV
jgi:hypothetical protein